MYDHLATYVREHAEADGVIVMVFGGKQGSSFAVQAHDSLRRSLPKILHELAAMIAADISREVVREAVSAAIKNGRAYLPEAPCPVCKNPLDAVSGPGTKEEKPADGDVTLCACCGSFLAFFGPNLALRELTLEDIAALPDGDRIALQRARRFWEARLRPQ